MSFLALTASFLSALAIGNAPALETASVDARAEVAGPSRQDEGWEAIWQSLSALRADGLTPARRLALRAPLEERLAAESASPRGRLLGVLLQRLDGDARAFLRNDASLDLGAGSWPFDGPESWLAAEVLAPGPARVRAVLSALDARVLDFQADPAGANARLRLAWEVGVEEARRLRLEEGALPIQRRLQTAFPAAWSTIDLALSLGLLGRTEEADALLGTEIARERLAGGVDPELWNRRGLLWLGVGDERRARDYFGRGLLLGSTNAAVSLARLDLLAGRLEEARRGFRALSWGPDPGAWTQRGYGLSLLASRGVPSRAEPR